MTRWILGHGTYSPRSSQGKLIDFITGPAAFDTKYEHGVRLRGQNSRLKSKNRRDTDDVKGGDRRRLFFYNMTNVGVERAIVMTRKSGGELRETDIT